MYTGKLIKHAEKLDRTLGNINWLVVVKILYLIGIEMPSTNNSVFMVFIVAITHAKLASFL